MLRSLLTKKPYLLIIALSICPLLRFVFDALQGLDYLTYQYLADDAFYAFQISKHIPEFNTGIPNSGFHPLVVFLFAPLHRYLAYEYAIPLSLLILVLCYALGTVILYRILRAHWERSIAILCCATWVVSGRLYTACMTGLESMVAAFLVLVFFSYFVKLNQKPADDCHRSDLFFLGLSCGVAFLARMDSPLIVAPAMCVCLFRCLRARRYAGAMLAIVPATLLPLAWIAYIHSQTGHFFPTSGEAIRVMLGLEGRVFVPCSLALRSMDYLFTNCVLFFVLPPPHVSPYIPGAILAVLGVCAILVLARSNRVSARRGVLKLDCVVLSGLFLWCCYYTFFQGGFRDWYFAQLGIGVYGVYLPLVLGLFHHCARVLRVTTMTSGIVVVFVGLSSQLGPMYPQEYDKYRSAIIADKMFSELRLAGNIGAFNAGIYNYFTSMDVINLDGVVNPEALEAYKEDRLPEYIRQRNITYLIEADIGQDLNFERVYRDRRFKLAREADLTLFYPPYDDGYERKTFLWKVEVLE
ncbi:hypothetical protein ACFL59_01810 [Planctomycetota bacterium]